MKNDHYFLSSIDSGLILKAPIKVFGMKPKNGCLCSRSRTLCVVQYEETAPLAS